MPASVTVPGDSPHPARSSAAFAVVLVAIGMLAGAAAQPGADVVFPRHPAPSPDGSQIAFSYQGDIWTVPSSGGEAQRLTAHAAYESNPCWSPDGQWIAFASTRAGNDDVYIIPVAGGAVRRLTWHSDNDTPTGWTPDSRAVLFSSRRYVRDGDNAGLFLVPLEGGTPQTVMTVGARSAVVSPDGQHLAFVRGSLEWWRWGYAGNARGRLWLCELDPPLSGQRSGEDGRQVPGEDLHGAAICTSVGLHIAEALYPRSRFVNLTDLGRELPPPPPPGPQSSWATLRGAAPDWSHPNLEPGINTDPAWFPDGEHLLYLSEFQNVANLKLLSIRSGGRAWVTRFTSGHLRYPALSRDGSLAAFEYEDGIYTVRIPRELPAAGSAQWPVPVPAPQRLAIRLPLDEKSPQVEWAKVNSSADELALSPDGKQLAFVYKGEVFAMKASEDEPFAYNLSRSQARDGQICWSPDSKSLLFVSDRAGNQDVYRVRSTDEDEPRLARSLQLDVEQVTSDPREETAPRLSPDGERIAYVRGNGTLIVMHADGSGARELVDGGSEIAFEWSPDSRWIVYTQEDDDYNRDVWIVAADGDTGPHNVSQHPDDDFTPAWSPDGKLLAFASSRAFLNQVDIWYVWLSRADEERSQEERLDQFSKEMGIPDGDAPGDSEDSGKGKQASADEKDEEKPEVPVVHIDFTDIHKRLHRLTTFPGSETNVLIAKDGRELFFVSDTDGKSDLWKIKWDGTEPKRLTQGGQEPHAVQWNAKGDQLFFLKKGGGIAAISAKGGDVTTYAYQGELCIDRAEQRGFVFDEGWRLLNDKFCDADFHGCDWRAAHDRYRPWALAASTYRDFQDVFRMMMGEINASHLGIWGGPPDPPGAAPAEPSQTGELGVLFAPSREGPGLRIVHVVRNSPADREESRLKVGERITSVDGTPLDATLDIARLLDHTSGERVRLGVRAENGQTREVALRPITAGSLRELLYDEEIEARRSFVRENSGGKVAYIHVAGMSEESLDLFERDLFAEANGRDALIVDVRDNGGGWTTDLLLTSLMAPDHATTYARGVGPGYPAERRLLYAWTKPIAVLCDEYSFSNAEIFSWSMRTLKRGPLIGQQTSGGVISTGGTNLLDGSYLRLPFRGWRSKLDGSPLEGTGCLPDIAVTNDPTDTERGIDRQLERAIAEALHQIGR